MKRCLLDTNILSYFYKEDTRSNVYWDLIGDSEPAISFVSVAELHRWPVTKSWGNARIHKLEEMIRKYLIIDSDMDICREWAHSDN